MIEKEMVLFWVGLLVEKCIIVEVCVYYFFFSEEDYEVKGSLIKCNLAVKKVFDCQVILDVINFDLIDVVVIDYVLYIWDEK